MANLYSSFRTPLLSYAASATILSDNKRYPTLLKTVPSDITQASTILSLAAQFGWSLISAIFTDDIYGGSGFQAFRESAKRHRIKFGCLMQTTMDNPEYSRVMRCLENTESTVVVLFMNNENAASIIAELSKEDRFNNLTFIASDAWAGFVSTDSFIKNRFSTRYLTGTIGVSPFSGADAFFRECYYSRNPGNTQYQAFLDMWESTFRCRLQPLNTTTLCESVIENRPRTNPDCMCTGEERLSESPDPKVAYVYDALFTVAKALHILQYDCTSLVNRTAGLCTRSNITGDDMLEVMRNLDFEGMTGSVDFDENDRANNRFDLVQLDSQGRWRPIGFFNQGKLNLEFEKLAWKAGRPPISRK